MSKTNNVKPFKFVVATSSSSEQNNNEDNDDNSNNKVVKKKKLKHANNNNNNNKFVSHNDLPGESKQPTMTTTTLPAIPHDVKNHVNNNNNNSLLDDDTAAAPLLFDLQQKEDDHQVVVKKKSPTTTLLQPRYQNLISQDLSRLNKATLPPRNSDRRSNHANNERLSEMDKNNSNAPTFELLVAQNNEDDDNEVDKKDSAMVASFQQSNYGNLVSRCLEEMEQQTGLLQHHDNNIARILSERYNTLFDNNLDYSDETKEDSKNIKKKSTDSLQQPPAPPRSEEIEQRCSSANNIVDRLFDDNAVLFNLNLDDDGAQDDDDERVKQKISTLASLRPDHDNYIYQPNISTIVQDTNVVAMSKTDHNSLLDRDNNTTAAIITPPYVVKADITDNDVLFGRGYHSEHHKGNIRYRRLVSQHAEQFKKLSNKNDRNSMAGHIIKTIIEERNGRFLRKANDNDIDYLRVPANSWIPITDNSELQKKVKNSLRDFRKAKQSPESLLAELNRNVNRTQLASSDEEETKKQQTNQAVINLANSNLPETTTTTTVDTSLLNLHHVANVIHRREQEILVRAASNLLLRQQQERQAINDLMQLSQQQQQQLQSATTTRNTNNTDLTTTASEQGVIDISALVSSILGGQNLQQSNKRPSYELLLTNNNNNNNCHAVIDDNSYNCQAVIDDNNSNKRQKMYFDMATRSWH